MTSWTTLRVWNSESGNELDGDARIALLREYRDTGAIAGATLVWSGPGMSPDEYEAACAEGPDASEVDWTGFEARS